MLRRTGCFALLLAVMVVGPARSGTWADSMFEELSRDFGAVPSGQVLTHHFRVTNNTGKTVVIGNVRPSCTKCTSVNVLTNKLAPGQSTSIIVQMDTSKFEGPKVVTVYVRFDQPQYEEVRLLVSATSRQDVSFNPDTLNFGQIKHGASPTSTVKLTFLGSVPQVQAVTCDSNYVQPSIKQMKRTDNFVEYELSANLRPDVPAGKWYTLIWVKTNDPAMPKLSVPLTVDVNAPLDLSPSAAQLGDVKVGTQVERRLVLRGVQPFKLVEVKGLSDELQLKDTTDDSRQMHVLILSFKPTHMGELEQTLKIITDLKEGNELEIPVHGKAYTEVKEFPLGKLLGRRKHQDQ